MRFNFEMGKLYDVTDNKFLGWGWRCACGKCSANWSGPYKTLREAKKASEAWADEIVEADDSTKH